MNSQIFIHEREDWKKLHLTLNKITSETSIIGVQLSAFFIIIMVLFYLFIQYYAVLKEIPIR